jgi:hypothetical protein
MCLIVSGSCAPSKQREYHYLPLVKAEQSLIDKRIAMRHVQREYKCKWAFEMTYIMNMSIFLWLFLRSRGGRIRLREV